MGHNSRRRQTKHSLFVPHAASVLAFCRGRFLLARSILAQSPVATNQGQSGHTGRAIKRQRSKSPLSAHTPCRTHIFSDTFSLRGAQTSRTRMAQGVCSAHGTSLHLTFSLLMFHPPSLLFPHGQPRHFVPVCKFLAELFPIRKRGSSAHPHGRRGVWLPGRSDAFHTLLVQSLKVELDQGEEPVLFYLGFFCIILTSTIAWSMVSSPTSRACWEIYYARKDWLQLRRIARSEWAIPPTLGAMCATTCAPGQVGTRRLGAMVSVCRQGRWPLYRRTGECLRFRTTTLGVGPRRGWVPLPECARTSAFASAYCTVPAAVPSARASVPAPMVSPWKSPHRVRLALSGEPREPKASSSFTSLPTTDSGAPGNESAQHRAKHQKRVHSGNHFASCSVDPSFACSVSAQEPAAGVLHCRRQPNPGKWTLRSGACLCRPPFGHPAWPRGMQSSSCGTTPARRRPHVGRGRRSLRTSFRQRSRQCGTPKRDRWRHRRNGELRAQSCEWFKKQTTLHLTSLPWHHLTTSPHAPNHPTF